MYANCISAKLGKQEWFRSPFRRSCCQRRPDRQPQAATTLGCSQAMTEHSSTGPFWSWEPLQVSFAWGSPSVRSRLPQSSHSCSAARGSSYPLLSSPLLVSHLHYGLKALTACSWSLSPTSFLCFSPNTFPACLISPWHLLFRAPKGTWCNCEWTQGHEARYTRTQTVWFHSIKCKGRQH